MNYKHDVHQVLLKFGLLLTSLVGNWLLSTTPLNYYKIKVALNLHYRFFLKLCKKINLGYPHSISIIKHGATGT